MFFFSGRYKVVCVFPHEALMHCQSCTALCTVQFFPSSLLYSQNFPNLQNPHTTLLKTSNIVSISISLNFLKSSDFFFFFSTQQKEGGKKRTIKGFKFRRKFHFCPLHSDSKNRKSIEKDSISQQKEKRRKKKRWSREKKHTKAGEDPM